MSDVAGTPLPTTGSTTQTNTTSQGHSPTFTSATNGFQVTEEIDLNLATTATGPFCTKVTQPGAIEFYEEWNPFDPTGGGVWWHSISDANSWHLSGKTHLAVTSYQILEILSINYYFAGIVQPNPFGPQIHEGKPYYRVMVECVVGGYQPNYNTGDVVTFPSGNYWIEGYLATAFRLNTPSNGSCWGYTDKPISGGMTASMSVAQSVSVSLPTTGSNTQTSAGTGGGIGFIDGGGGGGWNGCPGGTSGTSDDSNWNPQQAVTHAPTFTGSSGGINLSTWPTGTYYVYYRHSVREIRASPANSTGPAYDQTTVGGWISLGTTTDPSKWGVGQTTTPDPASHWPSSTTASPCVAGSGYSGIICSCNMDMVTDFITYEGQPYNNPYKTTSFTSQQCIDPSTGNSAYKILRDGLLQLRFEPIVQPITNPLPSSGSNSQSTCPNDGWLSFIDGGGGEGWMDCNGDGQDDGNGGGNDSNWNQKVPNVHAPTYIETNHPGGFGIDRTYPGDPSNALPAGGHNWEIKYTVHQIQYETVNCASGAVTGQINYNSPDEYEMVYSSASSQATAIRLIANPSRTTSTGCSAPQGWNITSTVVPLTLEVTWTGSGAGTTSQILSPPNSSSWSIGTLGGVYEPGTLTDNWITIIHVKRDGVIQ